MELRRGSEAWLNAARDRRRWIRQESSAPSNKTPPCVMDKHLSYTAQRRNVLGKHSPEQREISRGRGFYTPRPKRLPEGNLEGRCRVVQNPRPIRICRSSGECIKKYCPKGNITQYTPKGAGNVFDNLVPVDHII